MMAKLAPLGPVYQAGTLSGNPIAVAAGLTTLQLIRAPQFFETLRAKTAALVEGLVAVSRESSVAFTAQSVGGMFGLYFTEKCPASYQEVMQADKICFNAFFHAMLTQGIYWHPPHFEAGFVSAAHSEEDLTTTFNAARKAFLTLPSTQEK
ncbi:Glutamate-1-semialdehyde 2,1-aminomutase [Parachlamydia acanthamoebae]|uniref:Glutamate-1-semialdehyde 2,1-aminomutase n=1 Tax=Parachlamydia acanthamoebae TaxID=83552 RepID=A0A0C1E3H7_9BACT|nr:Glutamate-1-semialdehyde 2,1-aminomutase [Parachlamydia acanthamoebae]